jgi:hypothetical protein
MIWCLSLYHNLLCMTLGIQNISWELRWRDKENIMPSLSEKFNKYVKYVLQHFYMEGCRPFISIIYVGTKLSIKKCPSKPIVSMDMHYICYAIGVGSLVYTLDCTRLDIVHVVEVLTLFMAIIGR